MKQVMLVCALFCMLCFSSVLAGESYQPRHIPAKPDKANVEAGFDRRHVEVKFLDESDISLSDNGVPYDRSGLLLKSSEAANVMTAITIAGGSWKRMVALGESQMDELRNTAQENLNRGIADINNYFILTVPDNVTTEDWLDQLNALSDVEIALAMPLPVVAPVPPSYQGLQGYLNAAPSGIDANYAWTLSGGTGWPSVGGPIRICDFEYSWNLNHQEYPFATYSHPPLNVPSDPFGDDNHGTAVLGEMRSLSNGWGTTGGTNSCLLYAAPTYLDGSWQIGTAMSWMLSILSAGDVFLIEQQMQGPNYPGAGPQDGLVPIEWWLSWYNIVVTAVGNGIHVVEAAGNGQENLDGPNYAVGNGGHWPFLPANHSGAIIVGAGAAPGAFGGSDVDRSRLWFSNYGSRVDLQGWGEQVMTTGYGSHYSAEGKDLWYTRIFSGTSSASPIVASAVACLEGIYEDTTGGSFLTPAQMRTILSSTGSPQLAGTYPVSQNIGPRPDLFAAVAALPLTCCVNRGNADGIVGPGGPFDVNDLTYLVAYLFQGGPVPLCIEEGNVDGFTGAGGPIDVSDLTFIVAYLFQGGPPPPSC